MRFNDINDILATENKDELLEWSKTFLKKILSDTNADLYKHKYIAEVSGKIEDSIHTYEDGRTSPFKKYYANVYEIVDENKVFIGDYEISGFKGARVRGTFQPIFRNNKWYALTSQRSGIQVYTLPELKLIAETPKKDGYGGRVNDIYCPRFQTTLDVYNSPIRNEESSYYLTLVDEEIKDENWESAPFAFIETYDEFCNSDDYVHMVDLRNIENGVIEFYKEFSIQSPPWIPLRQKINIKDWSKEFPTFEAASVEHYSSITGTECGDHGWDSEQCDYFGWIGEEEDYRTTHSRMAQKQKEWINSDLFKKIASLLEINPSEDYKYTSYYSVDSAIKLYQKDPEQFKHTVLNSWNKNVWMKSALIGALKELLPNDKIKELLFLALDDEAKDIQVSAIKTLMTHYSDDKKVKSKFRKIYLLSSVAIKKDLSKFKKELKNDLGK